MRMCVNAVECLYLSSYACACACACVTTKCTSALSSPDDRILRYIRTYVSYVNLCVIAK